VLCMIHGGRLSGMVDHCSRFWRGDDPRTRAQSATDVVTQNDHTEAQAVLVDQPQLQHVSKSATHPSDPIMLVSQNLSACTRPHLFGHAR
jgi:muramidase (phage lysozyme)